MLPLPHHICLTHILTQHSTSYDLPCIFGWSPKMLRNHLWTRLGQGVQLRGEMHVSPMFPICHR